MIAEDLLPEDTVALAYAPRDHRPIFEALLALDRNLGRAVAGASEPIVGQLRLAWWRDALAAQHDAVPAGNPLLDQLVATFGFERARLTKLVDGWEALLLADPVDAVATRAFAEGRAAAWDALARKLSVEGTDVVGLAATRWAMADLAGRVETEDDRALILAEFARISGSGRKLDKKLRPLAVLDALSRRAIAKGGMPLLADRMSALVALRAGLVGR